MAVTYEHFVYMTQGNSPMVEKYSQIHFRYHMLTVAF